MKKRTRLKIFIALLGIILFTFLFAETIDMETAEKVANAKIKQIFSDRVYFVANKINIENVSGNLFFIFFLKPQGFVVVSAETNLPPVIAYSFENDFGEISRENMLLNLLKTDLELRLQNISEIPDNILEQRNSAWKLLLENSEILTRDFEQWPPEGTTPTGGWLEENWHQNSPYNDFCPRRPFTSERAVAGCPAVAMAQILNFLQTTNNVEFDDNDDYYHNYDGNQYWIDDDHSYWGFPSFPSLNEYLATLETHYQNDIVVTNEDKAALVFACGIAAHQVYSPNGSGTFGVSQAFEAYQKFGFEEVELLDETADSLYERIANNIIEAFPVHLAVVNQNWTMGHNVVIDGYNTDEYFHLNFGWGGTYNGWYLLPDEIPYGLTVIEGAIVDIFPAGVSANNYDFQVENYQLANYPNPFGISTTIFFGISNEQNEQNTISIYNIKGQKIRTLECINRVDAKATKSLYSAIWDGTDNFGKKVSPGIYLFQLKINDKPVTNSKCILLK